MSEHVLVREEVYHILREIENNRTFLTSSPVIFCQTGDTNVATNSMNLNVISLILTLNQRIGKSPISLLITYCHLFCIFFLLFK